MEVKFVTKEAFKVIGMEVETTVEENIKDKTIPKLWEKFVPMLKEIKNKKGFETFGICFSGDERFTYLACAEVENFDFIPEGMVAKIIPGYKYAVFTHKEGLDKIYKTYDFIYKEWLPKSGYKQVGPDFELYDDKFCGPDSEFYIYIPIEKL